MAHPERAATELAAARELGCRGVMIGTDIPGLHLGSPELDPVWEAAEALRMPVVVHPTHLHLPDELTGAGLKNAVGRAGPTAISLARLIYGGALVRFPELAVIASHGGGAFAAVAPRIVRNHELGWSESSYDPHESIARLYFDSVVLDSGYLQYLVRTFGADRFLLGSDFPFPWESDPVATVTGAALHADEQQAVLGGNAARLFDLEPGWRRR
jgi:aminocarboxymuconate-semialdehyde decarboxylase